MKQEPELIDIFAMAALQGICAGQPSVANNLIVRAAYRLASEMIEERKKYVGDSDE
jgi:hypothetical protein